MFPEKEGYCNVKRVPNTVRHDNNTLRKFIGITLVVFLLAGMFPGVVLAHPPKTIVLGYDAVAKVLKVTILHPSFTPSWHYIKSVKVEKNKKPAGNYDYKSQPGDEFSYSYEIPAEPGDVFVVSANCSMYGSRTESLTVTSRAAPAVSKP